jgi:hypothetical protein
VLEQQEAIAIEDLDIKVRGRKATARVRSAHLLADGKRREQKDAIPPVRTQAGSRLAVGVREPPARRLSAVRAVGALGFVPSPAAGRCRAQVEWQGWRTRVAQGAETDSRRGPCRRGIRSGA